MSTAERETRATDYKAHLQRALATVQQLRARLEQAERAAREPIAVIGVGCRFPGGEDGPDAFWSALRAGVDAVTDFPADRGDFAALYDPDPDAPGKAYVGRAGYLRHVDRIDAGLFGISPREANASDPQQRLALEVSWEALEHAGLAPEALKGSRTGVFMGVSTTDYARLRQQDTPLEAVDAYQLAAEPAAIAGRLSYYYGWHGPSQVLDTACSSSLVAVHLACQSLRRRECDLALAGGVNLILNPYGFLLLSKARALSPTGRSHTFDAAADGYTRGEGCGIVVLKRLADALVDGDPVLAVVRGTAVGHDGRTAGPTVPNGLAQQQVIRAALADAGLAPEAVGYVEAHGTGTALGDPIELQALEAVFGPGRASDAPLLVGSVKTNFGHLEAAAGVAGLIKAVLAVRHGVVPAHLHFRVPNPAVSWDRLHLAVPAVETPWPNGVPRVAGISSFGASGTNAHAIVAEPPPRPDARPADRPCHLLVLSAKTEPALRALAGRYEAFLRDEPDVALGQLCASANIGRARLPCRLAVTAATPAELRERLAAFAARGEAAGVQTGTARGTPRLALLFAGQGAQYAGMGRRLAEVEPVFRRALDRCAAVLDPLLGRPLADVLDDAALLDRTEFAQPALFALEYALAELWSSWGVRPAAVLGHSVGEYVAACAAGVFSPEDGLRLIAERGRLMQRLPTGGVMASVEIDEATARATVAAHSDAVAVAAVNGPREVVISGDGGAVEALLAAWAAQGIRAQRLNVSHAFHSPLMDSVARAFEQVVAGVALRPPRLRLVANLTGRTITPDEITRPDYWARHLRQTVRFDEGLRHLRAEGFDAFLEIGPSATLTGLAARSLGEDGAVKVASLRRGRDEYEQVLRALGALAVRGVEVDWRAVHGPGHGPRLNLPTYPFQRERFWYEPPAGGSPRPPAGPRAVPLEMQRLDAALPTCEWRIDAAALAKLRPLNVFGFTALGTATLLTFVAAAAREFFGDGAEPALEDVTVAVPVVLPEGEDAFAIQVVIDPHALPAPSFRCLTRTDGERAAGASWVLHAEGRIDRAEGVSSHIDGATTGELTPTTETDPAIARQAAALEDCTRAAVAGAGGDAPLLPARIVACVLRPTLDRAARWQARFPDGPAAGGDLVALNDSGEVCAELRGVRYERLGASAFARAARQRPEDLLYELSWPQQDRPPAVAAPPATFLIVADRGGVGSDLAARLRDAGAACTLVEPDADDDLVQLLEQFGPDSGTLGVVHLCGLDVPAPEQTTAEDLQATGQMGSEFVLRLVRALLARPAGSAAKLWLVTRGAVPAGEPAPQFVAAAPLWGLGRVVSLEHPDLWGGLIDLDPAGDSAAELAAELFTPAGEDQVAFRAGRRHVARLVAAELPPAGPPPVRRSATYLISGGLGGLGRVVARWLVEQGARHLVLTARRRFPDRADWDADGHDAALRTQIAALRDLERRGAAVRVVQADVADAARMAEVLAEIDASPWPLKGVLHLAGVAPAQEVATVEPADFRAVLRPKVEGAWVLHELTHSRDLDFWVGFSSIASVWGSQRLAGYAAGNHFLDALAHHRRALGLPALTVNWGPWLVESELAGAEVLAFLRAAGLRPLAPEQAVGLLGRLVRSSRPQVAVTGMDWAQFKVLYEARGRRPLLELIQVNDAGPKKKVDTEVLRRLRNSPPPERPALMNQYVRQALAGVLGLRPEEVAPDAGVMELGLDSLMAMEVMARCKSELGVLVSPRDLLERPTVDAWAALLLEQIGAGDDATDAPTAEPAGIIGWSVLKNISLKRPADLQDEPALADDIRPAGAAPPAHPDAVLLTGATGFVGAFLLEELLRRTVATVHCLVRCRDAAEGQRRLRENLGRYGLGPGLDFERLGVVPGDLARPRFGLDEAAFAALGRKIGAIYHNGAGVNFAQTYEQLKAANVGGTLEVLRLAGHGAAVHFVSTYGVWGAPDRPDCAYSEDDDLAGAGWLYNGYVQSKWVAEKTVELARARGFAISVYRLGKVSGHSRTGACLTTSFVCRMIKGCIQLGLAPRLDQGLEITPVDYVAPAVVAIAAQPGELGKNFHVLNETHIPFGRLMGHLQTRGYAVEEVSPERWWEELQAGIGNGRPNELHALIDAAAGLLNFNMPEPVFGFDHVRSALAGTDIRCPEVDERLLDTYLDYFVRCGYLNRPGDRG